MYIYIYIYKNVRLRGRLLAQAREDPSLRILEVREFKDVVFEDVVLDNSRFDIDVTLQNNI